MNTQTIDRYQEYDAWGWFYNQTMGPEYCKTQLPVLEKLLLSHVAPTAHLLDVCCGTGHLVEALIQKGYSVTGIDGSEQMLNYARENAPQADFVLADARTFQLSETFDAAFSTSASLNHILELEQLEQVFTHIHNALQPSGLFLFDLNHHTQMQKWWRDQVAEGEIHSDYAWAITPHYDGIKKQGAFTVTMYRSSTKATLSDFPKRWLYQLLSLDWRRLNRWRLKLLDGFDRWQPSWQKSQATYEVAGYEVSTVAETLLRSGFQRVEVFNVEGDRLIDENHSAYFVAYP